MPVFGYHAVYERDFASAIAEAAAHGFQYVQFDLNVPRFYIDRLPRRQLVEIKSRAANSGVRIAFHAPGDNVGLFCDYPLIRRGLLDHIRRILEKANDLDARHLTVHPLQPPSFRRADTLEDGFQEEHADYFKAVFKENIAALAAAAGDVLLLAENCRLGKIAAAALTEILAERDDVFLALDWQKMHSAGPVPDGDQRDFFLAQQGRIRELHLHDMNAAGRSHLKPGQGNLDFTELFRRFYNRDQWLTVEVRPFAEAWQAREMFTEIMKRLEIT
jgi:sugar phosphate isomerase/epimerase